MYFYFKGKNLILIFSDNTMHQNVDDLVFLTSNAERFLYTMREHAMILDVREQDEYNQEHIPGSVLVPLSQFVGKISNVLSDTNDDIIIMCRSGKRAQTAREIILQLELAEPSRVMVYEGGILRWREEGHPTQRGK